MTTLSQISHTCEKFSSERDLRAFLADSLSHKLSGFVRFADQNGMTWFPESSFPEARNDSFLFEGAWIDTDTDIAYTLRQINASWYLEITSGIRAAEDPEFSFYSRLTQDGHVLHFAVHSKAVVFDGFEELRPDWHVLTKAECKGA